NRQVHFLTVSEKFDFDKMQTEVLKSHVQEALKPFGDLVKDSKINIKITKNPDLKGYEIEVDVEPGKPHKKSS
ncbi:MAG: hypothetical protein QOD16_10885, partial [Nitrososphaeraceae archaeon]|nr:hypothetical protein [Nitrososphaeraceae archaeon]